MIGWVNSSMDHRPPPLVRGGLYNVYDLEHLPPMDVLDAFRSAHTLQDITDQHRQLLEDTSPTACWFDAGAPKPRRTSKPRGGVAFYHDQQDCCVWSYQDGRVYANHPTRVCVARSLPHFLSRMYVENLAWLHLHGPRYYQEHVAADSPMHGIVWRYVEHMARHYPAGRKDDPFNFMLGQ